MGVQAVSSLKHTLHQESPPTSLSSIEVCFQDPIVFLHATLMSLQWCLDAFLRAVQGNVMQTPLINHSIGIKCLNGTASSASQTMYFHGYVRKCGCAKTIQIHTLIFQAPNKLICISFFFFSFSSFSFAEKSSLFTKWQGIQKDTSCIKPVVAGIIHLWLSL